MSKPDKNVPFDAEKLAEKLSSDRTLARRTFLKVGSLIGGSLPLVVTLSPLEARAQASGS